MDGFITLFPFFLFPPPCLFCYFLCFLCFFFASEGADADATKPLSLVQELPAPQLSHYEGLFAKYLQSLPALER